MSRPQKGSPEYELWVAAIEVAVFPPLRAKGARSEVPFRRIEALRAALDGVGIDWRTQQQSDRAGRGLKP